MVIERYRLAFPRRYRIQRLRARTEVTGLHNEIIFVLLHLRFAFLFIGERTVEVVADRVLKHDSYRNCLDDLLFPFSDQPALTGFIDKALIQVNEVLGSLLSFIGAYIVVIELAQSVEQLDKLYTSIRDDEVV